MASLLETVDLEDGSTELRYDDKSRAIVRWYVPVDKSGNAVAPGPASNVVATAGGVLGSNADSAAVSGSVSATIIAVLKGIYNKLLAKVATTIADGDNASFGAKADAANTATDTTPVSGISVFKQISSSIQAIAVSVAGVLAVSPAQYSFSNLAANATTTVKSGAGALHALTINTKGASLNTITLYDNTAGSGTKIATIDSTSGPLTLTFNVKFTTGLTVVIATGTAANITISYL